MKHAPLYCSEEPITLRAQAASAKDRLAAKLDEIVPLFLLGVVAAALAELLIDKSIPINRGWALLTFLGGYSLLNLTAGGTPGKRIRCIRILDRTGTDAIFRQRLVRWLVHYAIPMIVIMLSDSPHLFGVAWPGWRHLRDNALHWILFLQLGYIVSSTILIMNVRRSLADLLSGTYVGVSVVAREAKRTAFEVIPTAMPASESTSALSCSSQSLKEDEHRDSVC